MKVLTNELKEGMTIGKTVYYGSEILIKKGEKVTLEMITKIKKYKILQIEIKDGKTIFEKEGVQKKEFARDYSKSLENSKEIMDSLKSGKVEVEKIEETINMTLNNLEKNEDILLSLLEANKDKNYIYQHSLNTMAIALIIGRTLNYSDEQLEILGKGAFLHDVGMLEIDDKILNKKDKLTPKEIEEIEKHPLYGAEKVKELGNEEIINIIKMHHEKLDGSGYPNGLKGDEISEYARIVGLADLYAALTEYREYRDKFYAHDAMKMLMEASNKKMDFKIMKKFLTKMPIYPINSVVNLNTGIIGKVVKGNENPFRPIVDVEENGTIKRIDLNGKENLTIFITGLSK